MGPSTSRPSASPTDAARHLHQRRRNRRPRHQFPRWTRSTSTKCSFRGSPRGRPHELGRRRPHIRDCKFTGNQGAAIRTLSTTAGQAGIIHVSVTRTTANRNQQGIRFEGNSFGVVSNSTASNNTLNGFVVFPQSVSGAEMNIVDSDANNNKQFGVFVGGTRTERRRSHFQPHGVHNSTNQLSVNAGGQILSNGRNHIGIHECAGTIHRPVSGRGSVLNTPAIRAVDCRTGLRSS
jgi:hypothetical protein